MRWYERRSKCEGLFRDLKDQRHLETIRLPHTERVERLLFGMMVLSYAPGAPLHTLTHTLCVSRWSLDYERE